MSEDAKIGRPRKEVDWDLVDSLCEIHCTKEEICSIIDMCEETLTTRCRETHDCSFSSYYKKACAGGKRSLRRAQFDSAYKGNATMLVWLGKQWLNQRDIPVEETGDTNMYEVVVSATNETSE